MKELLQKLSDTFGPSGMEDSIREVIRKEVRGAADEVRIDTLGNLIAHKRPATTGGTRRQCRKVMIAAHLDEIGLIVTHIDKRGFARFSGIGGVHPRNLPGGRVRFVNGTSGVIGLEPTDRAGELPTIDKMFIDVGAAAGEDCPIQIGDVAAFERPFLDLGGRVVAKSMDDRVGCAVAIEALRKIRRTPHDLFFVFTSQAEVGARGAQTSAYGIDPEIGFSIDVTGCGDTPGKRDLDVSLGAGPGIKIRDGSMLSDPRIVNWMIRTAEQKKIPYQREVLLGGFTDSRAMQLVRAGIPVGCVSIPCRYVHSPSEMVDMKDAHNAVKLVVALLSSPISLE